MRQLFLLSLLSCALLAVGTASAKSSSGKGKGAESHQGTIVAVNKTSVTIDIGVERPQKLTVKVDDKTAVTSGSQKGTIADLAKGQIVTVEISKNYATKIDVVGVVNPES
jgi:hypothetical protein